MGELKTAIIIAILFGDAHGAKMTHFTFKDLVVVFVGITSNQISVVLIKATWTPEEEYYSMHIIQQLASEKIRCIPPPVSLFISRLVMIKAERISLFWRIKFCTRNSFLCIFLFT